MSVPASEADRLRSAQSRIAQMIRDQLWAVFIELPFDKPGDARNLLLALVPELVERFGEMAATVAADVYEEWRAAARAPGRYAAVMAASPYMAAVEPAVRFAAGALWTDNPVGAFMDLHGQVEKFAVAAARETIKENVTRDPQAAGWQRRVRSDGCAFCRMLADRGGVYKRDTADFAAHPECNCAAVPSWDRGAREVHVRVYEASARTSTMTPEQRAEHHRKTRDWMRKNGYLSGKAREKKEDDSTVERLDDIATSSDAGGSSFERLTREQLEHQLKVIGPLKDSKWKDAQMARVRDRLAELAA